MGTARRPKVGRGPGEALPPRVTRFMDDEERAMITAYERGEYRPVKNQKQEKAKAQAMAREWMRTERKEARLNIRLRPSTLAALKARAAAEGLPYQVLIASLIHKYVFPAPPAAAAEPARMKGAQIKVPPGFKVAAMKKAAK